MRSTTRDIRFDVEMISDALAVRKIAGVIIAESVSYCDGAAIGICARSPARPSEGCSDVDRVRSHPAMLPDPSTPPGPPGAESTGAAG